MGNRFAADEAALIEEPLVLAVELLERVVRQDRRPSFVRDSQYEGIPATDRSSRRCHEFVVRNRLIELGALGLVDAVAEGGVDHDGDQHPGILGHHGQHRLIQLHQAGD